MFSGSSQQVLYTEECQRPFRERDKRAFSQGGSLLNQSSSGKIFRFVEKGAWSFLNQDKGVTLSLVVPSSSGFES